MNGPIVSPARDLHTAPRKKGHNLQNIEVPRPHHCREAAITAASFQRCHAVMGLPKGHVFVELGMGVRCADQEEVAVVLSHERTAGPVAGESIAARTTQQARRPALVAREADQPE